MARLLTLKGRRRRWTAIGNVKIAKDLIAAIKVVAPKWRRPSPIAPFKRMAAWASAMTPSIAGFFTLNRFLRLADGPDEVHMSQLGKHEDPRI
jgi:acyl-CoA dehydrogenase